MILLTLLLSLTARADCLVASHSKKLDEAIEQAETFFAAMDMPAFKANVQVMRTSLSCVREPVSLWDAARIHKVEALNAYVDQREADVILSFWASRKAAPDSQLSTRIAPKGNLLRELYERSATFPGQPSQPVRVPKGAALMIDGELTQKRPVDRPAVVQLLQFGTKLFWNRDAQGRVQIQQTEDGPKPKILWSGLVAAGDQPPDWYEVGYTPPAPDLAPPAPDRATLSGVENQPKRPRADPDPVARRPMLIVAGATAVVAGGLYSAALFGKSRYKNPLNANTQTDAALDAHRARNNAMAYTSMVLGVTAAGVGVVAVLRGQW